MACTLKHADGKADETQTPTGTQGVGRFFYGPPAKGAVNHRGVFLCQATPGTSGTYRWLYDELTPGVGSPTAWTWSGL